MITTHIAGLDVAVGGRMIQRCAVCGLKMVDSKNAAVPQNPDGSYDSIGTWKVGELVEHEEGNPQRWSVIPHIDGAQLPKNACINSLVEDKKPRIRKTYNEEEGVWCIEVWLPESDAFVEGWFDVGRLCDESEADETIFILEHFK